MGFLPFQLNLGLQGSVFISGFDCSFSVFSAKFRIPGPFSGIKCGSNIDYEALLETFSLVWRETSSSSPIWWRILIYLSMAWIELCLCVELISKLSIVSIKQHNSEWALAVSVHYLLCGETLVLTASLRDWFRCVIYWMLWMVLLRKYLRDFLRDRLQFSLGFFISYLLSLINCRGLMNGGSFLLARHGAKTDISFGFGWICSPYIYCGTTFGSTIVGQPLAPS